MKRSYRDLFIWQSAVDLAVTIYDLTSSFPGVQRYVLIQQMQHAAVSVASNIAEGKGRLSQRELRHFLGNARGSLFELDTQLEIAVRVGYLDANARLVLDQQTAQIGAGINRLIQRLDKNKPE